MKIRFLKPTLSFVLVLISLFTSSCGETPTVHPIVEDSEISDVQVSKADPKIVETRTEEFPLPNCGGTSELQQGLATQMTVKKNVKVSGTATLTVGVGSVPIGSVIQGKLETQISATYAAEQAQENSILYNIVLKAAPKSHVVYTIQWIDKEFTSTVSYTLGDNRYETDYVYILSVPFISASEEKDCQNQSPNASQPPTSEPTMAPGQEPEFEELAFVSDRGQSIGDFQAFVIDTNNPNPVNYQPFSANPPGYERVYWPSFCGGQLAVEAQDKQENGNAQWIYFLDRVSPPARWGLGGGDALGQPRCSPDGIYLAYSAHNQDGWMSLFVADRNGSFFSSYPQNKTVGRASWSQSMASMLFPVSISDDNKSWAFYLMKNFGKPSYEVQNLNFTGVSPSISPDGRQIAYYCPDDLYDQYGPLCVTDIGGGSPRVLVTTDISHNLDFVVWVSSVTPVWSSDGQWIYYLDYEGGDYDIFRIRSNGGSKENITRDWPSNELMPATR